ncbi:MAG: TlpA disulfide reductase family protein [Planctomycetota bacterium]|jgi:thiol-disulfide isomerase/thioredoxin
MMKRSVLAQLLVLIAVSPLLAAPATKKAEAPKADAWATSRLARCRLGQVWSGPDVKLRDLRGKVVLLEYWGYHCPPCIRSMPHLAKLHSRYGSQGLVVIGAHASASGKDRALAIVRRIGVNYTIVGGATVPGLKLTHIPHALVFDGDGKTVYQGFPDRKMDRAITQALARLPHPLLGSKKYTAMASAAGKVRSGRLGEAWKECKAKAGAKGKAGLEASDLLARLDRHGRSLLDKARQAAKAAPAKAKDLLIRVRKQFRGAPYAEQAEKLLAELAPKPPTRPGR